MKNKKILVLIISIIMIVAIVSLIIAMPKIQLNKAVNYLKNGEYKEAYQYINNKSNEENKEIVKELTTEIFCDRAGKGIKKVGSIMNQCTNILKKVNRDDIDYTLDDNVNADVSALSSYILLEDEISKEMISDEMQDCYTKYFYILKYVKENFYDMLDNIDDDEFISNVANLGTDMNKMANDCFSYADNHKFKAKTQDIYQEISMYIKIKLIYKRHSLYYKVCLLLFNVNTFSLQDFQVHTLLFDL